MTTTESLGASELTFSQAQGFEALPQPLALGEISDEARLRLWNLIFMELIQKLALAGSRHDMIADRILDVFGMLHIEFLMKPVDEFVDVEEFEGGLYRMVDRPLGR